MILQVTCKKCRQVVAVDWKPSPYFSENFFRNAYVCNDCGPRPVQVIRSPVPDKSRLPCRDDP